MVLVQLFGADGFMDTFTGRRFSRRMSSMIDAVGVRRLSRRMSTMFESAGGQKFTRRMSNVFSAVGNRGYNLSRKMSSIFESTPSNRSNDEDIRKRLGIQKIDEEIDNDDK